MYLKALSGLSIRINERRGISCTLTRKLKLELITSTQVRFETRCKMMSDERGETLVAIRTHIQSTIKRMKTSRPQRWCISNVMQVSRSKKKDTIILLKCQTNLVGTLYHSLHMTPTVP